MKYPKIDFKKYGESVYVSDGSWSSEVYYGYIEPLRYKSRMYMADDLTQLGYYGEDYCLYIGPPDILLEKLTLNAVLNTASGKKYNIYKTEQICAGGKPVYVWAIIRLMPAGD